MPKFKKQFSSLTLIPHWLPALPSLPLLDIITGHILDIGTNLKQTP